MLSLQILYSWLHNSTFSTWILIYSSIGVPPMIIKFTILNSCWASTPWKMSISPHFHFQGHFHFSIFKFYGDFHYKSRAIINVTISNPCWASSPWKFQFGLISGKSGVLVAGAAAAVVMDFQCCPSIVTFKTWVLSYFLHIFFKILVKFGLSNLPKNIPNYGFSSCPSIGMKTFKTWDWVLLLFCGFFGF